MKKLVKIVGIALAIVVVALPSTALARSRGGNMTHHSNQGAGRHHATTVSTQRTQNTVGNTARRTVDVTKEYDTLCEENYARKQKILEERVKAGLLTQDEADEILQRMKERQENCLNGNGCYGYGLNQEQGQGRLQGRGLRDGCFRNAVNDGDATNQSFKGTSNQGRGFSNF